MRDITEAEPTIVLRSEQWTRNWRRLELYDDGALGRALGVNPATVWRLRMERLRPSNRMMARALWVMDDARFDDLFEVIA